MSAFHPLRTLALEAINVPVRAGGILDMLSKRAPVIVIIALSAALVGAWTSAYLARQERCDYRRRPGVVVIGCEETATPVRYPRRSRLHQ